MRRWALVHKAGQLDTPGVIDFLLGVALAPLPAPETAVSSPVEPGVEPRGGFQYKGEMLLRMEALRSIAALGRGAQRNQAHRALLDVVERADRPVRRQAAITFLLSVPDSERAMREAELKPVLPPADADVLNIQLRRSPEPGPALPAKKASASATAASNTPAPVK